MSHKNLKPVSVRVISHSLFLTGKQDLAGFHFVYCFQIVKSSELPGVALEELRSKDAPRPFVSLLCTSQMAIPGHGEYTHEGL